MENSNESSFITNPILGRIPAIRTALEQIFCTAIQISIAMPRKFSLAAQKACRKMEGIER